MAKEIKIIDEDASWELVSGINANNDKVNYVQEKSATVESGDDVVTLEEISAYRKELQEDAVAVSVAQNAVSQHSVKDVTLRRAVVQTSLNPYFSINLDQGGMPATNQRDSGRCWMFGILNLFRFGTREKLNMHNFEFSESYLYFWHIFEQCNAFMEFVMETSHRETTDRVLWRLFRSPVHDGGDWGIAVNLAQKYGLIPKSFYPESHTSSQTNHLLDILTDFLRSAASQLRCILQGDGDNMEEARKQKHKILADAFRILSIHMGTPPTEFDWEWRDKKGSYHKRGRMTPLEFAQEYVTIPYSSYVSIIQDPRNEYYRLYTVPIRNTVRGGRDLVYLNLPPDEVKSMTLQMLKDNKPVWFACNVNSQCNSYLGLWDADLYDFQGLYGIRGPDSNLAPMSKADKIRFGGHMGTHVMLFTGVDVDCNEDGVNTRRWRVENSWGDSGDHGYFTMNDNWFDEYIFEIAAPPCYLSDKAKAGMETDPIVLPNWDPVCSIGCHPGSYGQEVLD